jgi:hypothetical protein
MWGRKKNHLRNESGHFCLYRGHFEANKRERKGLKRAPKPVKTSPKRIGNESNRMGNEWETNEELDVGRLTFDVRRIHKTIRFLKSLWRSPGKVPGRTGTVQAAAIGLVLTKIGFERRLLPYMLLWQHSAIWGKTFRCKKAIPGGNFN